MKKILLVALVLVTSIPLFAQDKMTTSSITITRQSLLADSDVLWLGETYSVFLLDEFNAEKTEDSKYLESMGIKNNHRINVAPIKNIDLRKKRLLYPQDFELIHTLLEDETSKKGVFYADAECSKKLSYQEFEKLTTYVDTIITFDPETFQEIVQVVLNHFDPSDVNSYKAKHLVYYNQRTNTWGTLMEAVAPVRDMYDLDGNFIERVPVFWMKIDNKTTLQDLNKPDISWARSTVRSFDWEEFRTVKAIKTIEECMNLMFDKTRKNAATEDIRTMGGDFEKFTTDEKAIICQTVDTIVTYDPNTFEEKVQVVVQNLSGKDVIRFRFLQEWYWDNKKSRMMMNTVFFAPVINRYDMDGEFLFSMPMFWKTVKQ